MSKKLNVIDGIFTITDTISNTLEFQSVAEGTFLSLLEGSYFFYYDVFPYDSISKSRSIDYNLMDLSYGTDIIFSTFEELNNWCSVYLGNTFIEPSEGEVDPIFTNSPAFNITSSHIVAIGTNTTKITDAREIHSFPLPSTSWVISHLLNKYPSVTIVDTSGTVVVGDVRYIDTFNIVVTFINPFAGKAFLN